MNKHEPNLMPFVHEPRFIMAVAPMVLELTEKLKEKMDAQDAAKSATTIVVAWMRMQGERR